MARNKTKDKLWTGDLVLAALVSFLLVSVFYLLMTTMALYAVERFGASDVEGGLASGIFVLGATVARLFAGNLADLFGRRRILLLSLGASLVASMSYLLVASFGVLLAVRAVQGATFALASTAVVAMAQSLIPASRRAEGTGYYTLSFTLGIALGPFLALMLIHGPGYPVMFIVAATALGLALLMALFLRPPQPPLDLSERARLRRFHPRDMLHPAVLPVAATMLVLAVGYSGVLSFLNSYATEKSLEAGAGVFFLVYAAVMLLSRPVAGRIQDRHGDHFVVYTAIAAFAAALAVLALAGSNGDLVVAGAVMGLGYGVLTSALQAIAIAQVPGHRVGVAVSTHYFMVDLGLGLGPVVLGLLLQHTGYEQMYVLLAGLVLASAGLYYLAHGRSRRSRRSRRSPGSAPASPAIDGPHHEPTAAPH